MPQLFLIKVQKIYWNIYKSRTSSNEPGGDQMLVEDESGWEEGFPFPVCNQDKKEKKLSGLNLLDILIAFFPLLAGGHQ